MGHQNRVDGLNKGVTKNFDAADALLKQEIQKVDDKFGRANEVTMEAVDRNKVEPMHLPKILWIDMEPLTSEKQRFVKHSSKKPTRRIRSPHPVSGRNRLTSRQPNCSVMTATDAQYAKTLVRRKPKTASVRKTIVTEIGVTIKRRRTHILRRNSESMIAAASPP